MFSRALLDQIRQRFYHVDRCPYQGARIFFENAGGSLTLKSVVAQNRKLSMLPDNQGRDNPASKALVNIIQRAKRDMLTFLGASDGVVFVGESGTECLFRVLRAAILGTEVGGVVLGSTLEHPATVSACQRWAKVAGKSYITVSHDVETASVSAAAYAKRVTPDTRVATVIQTSPVTGMQVDVGKVVAAIRAVAPACLIVVDGIQHAPHGTVAVDQYAIDAYAVSAYKVFSKHNYGVAWVSPRLSLLPHDKLDGTAEDFWELGTRDAAAYATFTEVVKYLDWLGSRFTATRDSRARLLAAGQAIREQEHYLLDLMLYGDAAHTGLADMPTVYSIGGVNNPRRAGLVSFAVEGLASADVVAQLNAHGVRTHTRQNDYFSANILTPLGLQTCVRASLCHYNSADEVRHFLKAMHQIIPRG